VGTAWVFDEMVKSDLSHAEALILAKKKNDQFE
jgi:hypothetical protein